MGWATLPIFTFTPPATFSTTGTCFSFAPSDVFSFISFMGWPQHTSSPAPPCRTSTILPQTSHLYTSYLFAMVLLRFFDITPAAVQDLLFSRGLFGGFRCRLFRRRLCSSFRSRFCFRYRLFHCRPSGSFRGRFCFYCRLFGGRCFLH